MTALELVPVSRNDARAFVRTHHRHGTRPASADVLRVGLAVDGQLVAVAIAGIPARELMDGRTLEISRVCTLGHENACSRLYGALVRAGRALGWRRFYTYTRTTESGSSLRAAGFVVDGEVPGRVRARKVGTRPRYDENLLGERVENDLDPKTRWIREVQP